MIMNQRSTQPTFAFADDTPVRGGGGRKHRRGRGYGIPGRNRNNAASASVGDSASANRNDAKQANNSYRHQSGHYSSAAANAQWQHQQQQLQANYVASDAWDDQHVGPNKKNNNNDQDGNNSCTGSLTYSASSSVKSEESSNDSSFADIIKIIDSEGEGATEIKEFMAKQAKAASDGGGAAGYNQFGQELGGPVPNAAVQGWMQRVEDRSRAQQAMQQAQAAKKKKQQHEQHQSQQPQFTMAATRHAPGGTNNVDFNYSKDDSSEDTDVFSVDFDDNVLETIAGLDHDDNVTPRHNVTLSSQSHANVQQSNNNDPFRRVPASRQQDPFQPMSPQYSSHSPSSPGGRSGRSASGSVTPPPNSRLKRTSTPPGSAPSISRTGSRHSKSSSDGSWDTPAPSSPPHGGMMQGSGGAAGWKPPHARSAPTGGRALRRKGGGRDEKAVEDLSEAFYAKSWMCGFADAFNFDEFGKFQK